MASRLRADRSARRDLSRWVDPGRAKCVVEADLVGGQRLHLHDPAAPVRRTSPTTISLASCASRAQWTRSPSTLNRRLELK